MTDKAEIKAEAAAAKARVKAMRPWWKRKRVLIPVALVGAIVAASASSSTKEKVKSGPTDSVAVVSPAGIKGEAKEIADIESGACTSIADGAMGQLAVVVTNRSSKRSNYTLSVSFFDAAGVKVGDGYGGLQNLEPGAVAKDEITGFLADSSVLSDCKLVEVDRIASI